ncbi:hypothetical protein [Ralstonia solanacearum]|uniref:hypothetical protein n=1 Tax=Ralstonia solanacearum TaxID=305 RepID=UPI0009B90302|nr:hypothetical protein [Ralstonia solanacearum]
MQPGATQRIEERPILFMAGIRVPHSVSAKKDAQKKSGRRKLAGGLAITAAHILAEALTGFSHNRENLNIDVRGHD